MHPPFEVSTFPGIGRCLLATRDINPGELILEDFSCAAGPKEEANEDVCIVCIRKDELRSQCHRCGLPICDKCKDHEKECEEIERFSGGRNLADIPREILLSCLVPLRLRKAMERNKKVSDEVRLLCDHPEARFTDGPHRDRCLSAARAMTAIDGEEISRLFGLLRVNSVDVGVGLGRALFPTFSLLSHSCVNNCKHVMSRCGNDDDGTTKEEGEVRFRIRC